MSLLAPTYKREILGFLFLFLGFMPLRAEDVQIGSVGPFSTLNNYDSPIIIPSGKAQDLLNVDITPEGKSVKKREGFAQAFALAITTSPTHGVYKFYDTNGNEIVLAFNDTRMSSSINGGQFQTIFSTGPNGATWQCVDSQGFAYCNNTSRTTLIKTNGITATSIASVNSTGTMVAVTPDRLVISGFSVAEAPNRIDFSESADFTSWVPPFSQGTDPNQITITAPGSRITHIVYAFNRLIWFKQDSFGYVLFGPNLLDWQVRTISPVVGNLDNASIYWNDVLYWRGQDGHFYSYDGANITRMSRDITNTIQTIQNRVSNSWTQTTSIDFGSGNFDPNVYADTITVSGQIQFTFPETFDTLRTTDTAGAKPVWDKFLSGSVTGNATVSNGMLLLGHDGGTLGRTNIGTVEKLTDYSQGTTYYVVISSLPTVSTNLSDLYWTFRSTATSSSNPDGAGIVIDFESTTTTRMHVANFSITGRSGAASTTIDYALPATVQFYLSTTTYQIMINDQVALSGTHTAPREANYMYLGYLKGTTGSATCYIDTFAVAPQTMTYLSAVNNAPSLTSWDSFLASKLDSNATHYFSIRASTNTIQVTSSTPSWTSITSGDIPSISTGTYFQIRDIMMNNGLFNVPALYSFTQYWLEGNASDKIYGGYYDYSLWWNVQSSSNSYNNRVIKYDMLNNGFTIYDIPMNGFYVKGGSLYFGSSTGGYIHKFGGVNDDNGSTINSYWKSKDYVVASSPFNDSEIVRLSFLTSSIQNSSMTVTYAINGSSSTAYTMSLYSPTNYRYKNTNLPLGKVGTTFNFKFGNDAADQPFEVFAIQYGFREKPWIPKN